MKAVLILCVLIAPFGDAVEQPKHHHNRRHADVHWMDIDDALAGIRRAPSPKLPNPGASMGSTGNVHWANTDDILAGILGGHAPGFPNRGASVGNVGERVKFAPLTPKKDPWLTPNEGVLISEHTRVYRAERGQRDQVLFHEIPRAIEDAVPHLLNDEKYQKANVENINNPNHYSNASTAPASVIGQWPHALYPEIMVVVVYDLYEKLGKNLTEVIPYLMAYWNGVDILFRSFENPKILLNIVKIIIETEAGVFDYMKSDSRDIRYVSASALYDAQLFWYQHKNQIPLESYDMVASMTTRASCTSIVGSCEQRASGVSRVGTICQDDSSVMIDKVLHVADDGKFGGIVSTAHELGHTLGMQHDQFMKHQFPFRPQLPTNTPSCKNDDTNYIMYDNSRGPSIETPYKLRWSQCSLEQLEKFIRERNPTCLYNPPTVGQIHIPRLLPGKLATLDDYCEAKGYSAACENQQDRCKWPLCKKSGDEIHCYIDKSILPAEGTRCDDNDPDKFCFFGECVSGTAFT